MCASFDFTFQDMRRMVYAFGGLGLEILWLHLINQLKEKERKEGREKERERVGDERKK